MLLQFDPEKNGNVENFRELYDVTLNMLNEVGGIKTMVLGPVTSDHSETQKEILKALRYKAKRLSGKWTVLDLPSFQQVIVDLIKRSGIKGYPHVILEEFTIPLIKSGIFKTIFMRLGYEKSIGATIEHDMALANEIQIVYFE